MVDFFLKITKGIKSGFFWLIRPVKSPYRLVLVRIPDILLYFLITAAVLYNFKNLKSDTTNLTNYGFAILAGMGSICFSWSRCLDSKEESVAIKKITNAGEVFFHSAVIFLIASIFKYSSLHTEYIIPREYPNAANVIRKSLSYLNAISLTYGYIKFLPAFLKLNQLLYDRVYKNDLIK
jgi:hypothetical protein